MENKQYERVVGIFEAAGGRCLWQEKIGSRRDVLECWVIQSGDLYIIQGYNTEHGGVEIYTNGDTPMGLDEIVDWLREREDPGPGPEDHPEAGDRP